MKMDILFIFVEGSYDERFFVKYFDGKNTKFIKYSQMNRKKIKEYIRSINRIPSADYIFIADSDGMSIVNRKKYIANKYSSCDEAKIFISQYEIESWYLAGLSKEDCKKYKIRYYDKTDTVTKEQFERLVPKDFTTISFMIEILQNYINEEAAKRNISFGIFNSHYVQKMKSNGCLNY